MFSATLAIVAENEKLLFAIIAEKKNTCLLMILLVCMLFVLFVSTYLSES